MNEVSNFEFFVSLFLYLTAYGAGAWLRFRTGMSRMHWWLVYMALAAIVTTIVRVQYGQPVGGLGHFHQWFGLLAFGAVIDLGRFAQDRGHKRIRDLFM
jgi:hypothetical protein